MAAHRPQRPTRLTVESDVPPELRPFLGDDDGPDDESVPYHERTNGPSFYVVHRPGSELTAEQIVLWIAETLQTVPDRTNYQWKVWFSEMAYGMVKERFWQHITLIGYQEWLRIPSPKEPKWSLRIRIAGTDGDLEDMFGDTIVDRVTIKIEIDDGNDGFIGA